MTAIPHTITISKEQEEFLDDNKDLSLSKITQSAIEEYIENRKITTEQLREVQRKLDSWVNISNKMRSFIEKRGLFDDYIKEDVS